MLPCFFSEIWQSLNQDANRVIFQLKKPFFGGVLVWLAVCESSVSPTESNFAKCLKKEKVFLPNPFRNFLYHFHFLCWHFPRHKAFMKKVVKKKYIVLWLCVVLNVILQNIWKKGKILVSNLIQTTPCITFTFCVAAIQKPYGAFKQNMTFYCFTKPEI